MSENDPNEGGGGAEDDLSAWAEALEEQKGTSAGAGSDLEQGGPLFGERMEPHTVSAAAAAAADNALGDINRVLDIPVQLSVELGRVKVPIKYILQLAQGSVVELDALAGEPMDVLVNGYLIAQGEVVVVNDKFGIRLTDVVTPSERLRRVSKG